MTTTVRTIEDVTLRIGEQLTLSPPQAQDAPAIHAAVQDPEIRRWLPLPRPYPLDLAMEFCTVMAPGVRASGRGLIRSVRERGEFAGIIDAKRIDWRAGVCEIGYWLVPAARGRGLMTSAVDVFSRWLLNHAGFERVELRIAPGNTGSIRVGERAGFAFEGTARNAGFTDSGRVDLAIYARIAADLE
ncbi:GNAT family N-acetyltransferase [Micromonospora sp. NPDC006766]|uniref:GNAT family N-acetyltransferase n=1 Tax=Micromonospora sp. NPDC006766 TaxID=3154778 RepID=UPI0033EBD42F